MPAGRYDIIIDQNADFSLPITFKDPTTGDPLDMSDFTFNSEIRANPGAVVIETFTIDESSKSSGLIVLTLTKDQTAKLIGKNYLYDLLGTAATITTRYMQGYINPDPGITIIVPPSP